MTCSKKRSELELRRALKKGEECDFADYSLSRLIDELDNQVNK
jgi:hypothetical protein